MGYELIWQPYKMGWAIWSTVVDAFLIEGVKSPEGVADYILGNKEYYYTGTEERNVFGALTPLIATCQFKSREDIIDYYSSAMSNIKDSSYQNWTEHGWETVTTPADTIYENLRKAYIYDIIEWDDGKTHPDPKAKEQVRQYWIKEAERVKREGVLTISGMTFQITEEGLEYKGKITKGPEIW